MSNVIDFQQYKKDKYDYNQRDKLSIIFFRSLSICMMFVLGFLVSIFLLIVAIVSFIPSLILLFILSKKQNDKAIKPKWYDI